MATSIAQVWYKRLNHLIYSTISPQHVPTYWWLQRGLRSDYHNPSSTLQPISRLSTTPAASAQHFPKMRMSFVCTSHSSLCQMTFLGVHSNAREILSLPKLRSMLHLIRSRSMPFSISSCALPRVQLKLPLRTSKSFKMHVILLPPSSPQ